MPERTPQQVTERAALHHLADALHHLVPERAYPEQGLGLMVLVKSPEAVREVAELANTDVAVRRYGDDVHTRTVVGFGDGTSTTAPEPEHAHAVHLEVVHIGHAYAEVLTRPMLPTQRTAQH